MREIIWIFVLAIIFSSCVDNSTNRKSRKFPTEQQEHFDKMLAKNKDISFSLGNKILEKEFNDSVKLAIGKYMDSTKLFINWMGRIKKINYNEVGEKSANISFRIEYVPEKYREIEFAIDYLISKDSVKSDKLYNTIKNLSNYSTVYFDGFIRTKSNGEAHYDSYSDDLMHSYPDFKFFIVDVRTDVNDTISENLKKAIDLSFEAIEPLKLNYKKEISKKESNKRIDKIAPQFKAAKEVLTEDEKSYIDRLTQALVNNFLYAE